MAGTRPDGAYFGSSTAKANVDRKTEHVTRKMNRAAHLA
jgi:hypothetical protein